MSRRQAELCPPTTPPPTPYHLRTYFNRPPRQKVHFAEGSSRTKQEFKDECDINLIVKNFVKTGALPPSAIEKRRAMWGDVSDVNDFQTAMDIVSNAAEGFAALPAAVRDKFHNDPGELLEWVTDPANKDEAVKLGLLEGEAPVKGEPTQPEGTPTGGGNQT